MKSMVRGYFRKGLSSGPIISSIAAVVFLMLLASCDSERTLLQKIGVQKFELNNGLKLYWRDALNISNAESTNQSASSQNALPVNIQVWFPEGHAQAPKPGMLSMAERGFLLAREPLAAASFADQLRSRGIDENTWGQHDVLGIELQVPQSQSTLEAIRLLVEQFSFAQILDEPQFHLALAQVATQNVWTLRHDSVMALAAEARSLMFPNTGYARSLAPSVANLRDLSRDEINVYSKRLFCPKQASIFIHGPIQKTPGQAPAEAVELLVAGLEKWHCDSPLVTSKEKIPFRLEHTNIKSALLNGVTLTREVETTGSKLYMAYAAPSGGNRMARALDLLAATLAGDPRARWSQKYEIEQNVAVELSVDSLTPRGPGLFEVRAKFRDPVTAEKVSQELLADLRWIEKNGMTKEEINFGLSAIERTVRASLQTPAGFNQYFGLTVSLFDSVDFFIKDAEDYPLITSTDIQKAIHQYLQPNRLVKALEVTKRQKDSL